MKDWDIIITPKDNLLAIDWKEIWRYRDMYWMYVKRNFSTAYKQRVLGPLWFIITPVMSIIVYVAVFGGIANIPTDGIPPALFYLLGISVWGFFSACLSATSNSFVENSGIFGKVYFPRIIMPLIAVTTQFFYFLIQFAIFLVFYAYYLYTGALNPSLIIHHSSLINPSFINPSFINPSFINPSFIIHCALSIVNLIFLMLLLAILAMGLGMTISAVTTKYRDIQMLFGKILNLLVYVTPVIYPLSLVTNPKLHLMMSLNPVTPIMEALKYTLLGAGSFSWLWLGYSVLMTIIFALIGLALFNKVQKSFMDTV